MDLFIKNLDEIRKLVTLIARDYKNRYQVDELLNAAYIGFKRAIANNPSLSDTQFRHLHILKYRVRCDIKDYIRYERKDKMKKRLENEGLHFPVMLNASFLPINHESGDINNTKDKHYILDYEEGLADFDRIDALHYLMNNSGLTNIEKRVIYLYFFQENDIRTVADILGRSKSGINNVKIRALKKIQSKAEKIFKSL